MTNWSNIKIPSRDFIEQFFTFLVPVENKQGYISSFRWRKERKLIKSIEYHQEKSEEFRQMCEEKNDIYLVKYFLGIYQDDSISPKEKLLSQLHLVAYLEAPAYQAVINLRYVDFENPQETQEDYLCFAKCLIIDIDYISSIYKKYKSSKLSLSKYFALELTSKIRDKYHSKTGQGKYSVWFSLKNVGKNKLTQELQELGLDESQIKRCLIAKECLFKFYSKSGNRWLKPKDSDYQKAADFCNQHHFNISEEEFKPLINNCLKARQLLPKINYIGNDIETYIFGTNCQDKNIKLEDKESKGLGKEMGEYFDYLNQVLINELNRLNQDIKNQAILILYYGLKLSGRSIGLKLKLNQATVSRLCQTIEKQLLNGIAHWAKKKLNINLMVIEKLDQYINSWIIAHYNKQVESVIRESFDSHLQSESREILQCYYSYQIPNRKIVAQRLNITVEQLKEHLENAKTELIDYLCNWVKDSTNIDINETKDKEKIKKVLEEWLKNSLIY
ncbi:MAG: hypothetical protein F6K10_15095 [Moorea sp. SIO2B7]|nr:hypothetical protein [Moorena sp. SIO2B7]